MIGYSGAGKPTLLNILRGFYKATSGKVYLGNTCLNEIDPKFFAENDF
ncbi:MAG: ATP-binding cassette domain-containing protein [Parachlamydiaceae bacterium]